MLGAVFKQLFRTGKRNASAAQEALSRARAALNVHDLPAAQEAIAAALRADPQETEAYLLRARLAKGQRQFQQAVADYRRALALRPESTEIRIGLAASLHQLAQFEDALDVLDEAAAISPNDSLVLMNRGVMLRELMRLAEAEQTLRWACRARADNHEAQCHLASVIYDQGRREEAGELLHRVLAVAPALAEAHWQLALQALGAGDFAAGWHHYQHRLRRHDAYVRARELPWWDGREALHGPLLVLAEQGLGDEIMFASCFGDLMAQVGECIVECDPRLGRLFARSFQHARILDTRDPAGTTPPAAAGAVAQIAAGSLPELYRRSTQEFPRHSGYLRASAKSVAVWRERLAAVGPGMKVGLSWQGGAWKTRRALRSIPLADLKPLFDVAGVQFISLQYTECEAELSDLTVAHGVTVQHWPEAIADCDETAGLVESLDLVISVTTSIVHLTGALGKPVWVLVPTAAEWRYLRGGQTMPWYPSARIFRQTTPGAWSPVVSEVADALRGQVARIGASGAAEASC